MVPVVFRPPLVNSSLFLAKSDQEVTQLLKVVAKGRVVHLLSHHRRQIVAADNYGRGHLGGFFVEDPIVVEKTFLVGNMRYAQPEQPRLMFAHGRRQRGEGERGAQDLNLPSRFVEYQADQVRRHHLMVAFWSRAERQGSLGSWRGQVPLQFVEDLQTDFTRPAFLVDLCLTTLPALVDLLQDGSHQAVPDNADRLIGQV